ncbi:anion permease, partial [Campylobacter novaezeelandiae]|nr:anion permease [Campylobacter novaezeelandiae]
MKVFYKNLKRIVKIILLYFLQHILLFSWLRYFFASGTAYVTAIIAIFASLAGQIQGANAQ